jgi:hypothetical protein
MVDSPQRIDSLLLVLGDAEKNHMHLDREIDKYESDKRG